MGFGERRDPTPLADLRELPIPTPALQFMMGGDYYVADATPAPRAALWGPVVRTISAFTDAPAEVFLVFLTGRGAVGLAKVALADLVGRRLETDALGRRQDRDMAERLSQASDFASRIKIASGWLRDRIESSHPPVTPVLALSDAIVSGGFRGTVSEAASMLGLTPRGLNKAFQREIGCSPKRMMRIARLQRVLGAIHPRPWAGRPLFDPRLEYHDQAHLDRDFVDLTGVSRCRYIENKVATQDRLMFTIV